MFFPCKPPHLLTALRSGALLALLAGGAAAQTTLSGSVFDGNGGPLLSGQVYHSTSGFSVPFGETLTVQAGAIIKLEGPVASVFNFGTLDVQGTALNPVYFTSMLDDSVGGDSNGDGPSTPLPGDWRLVSSNGNGPTMIDHAVIRYAGGAGDPGIQAPTLGAPIQLTNSSVTDCLNAGMDLGNQLVIHTVENCVFDDNGTYPIQNARLAHLEGLLNNTASGNGTGNYVRMQTPTGGGSDISIGPENVIGGVLVSNIELSTGTTDTLTLEAGLIVKFSDPSRSHVAASSDLVVNGTKAAPVVFTSFADDSHGGDTNNDGPSSGAPGDWGGLFVGFFGSIDVNHALLRFGGGVNQPPILGGGGDIVFKNSVVEHALEEGMRLTLEGHLVEIECNVFRNNGTVPCSEMFLTHLPGMRFNKAHGNAGGDHFQINGAVTTQDVTITPDNYPGDVLVFNGTSFISNAPGTVNVTAGCILKFRSDLSLAGGTGDLNVLGTAANPVILTSVDDDDVGGDTLKDGPPAGTPVGWRGCEWINSPDTTVEHLVIRYAGNAANDSACRSGSQGVTFRNIRVENAMGLDGFFITELNGDAHNLVAWNCNDNGIRLSTGILDTIDLYHCTIYGSGGEGIQWDFHTTGVVYNSVSWGNGGQNYWNGQPGTTGNTPFQPGEMFHSNGDPGLAGMDGNINQAPLFVAPNQGNLRLSSSSPCLDSARVAEAQVVVKDFEERSRLLPTTGAMLPDMGAYERSRWFMSVVGKPRLQGALELTVNGPAGRSTYLLGFLDGAPLLMDPFGYATVGVTRSKLDTVSVGTTVRLPLPVDPALAGVEFGIQTFTREILDPMVGENTNLYRGTLTPPLKHQRRIRAAFHTNPRTGAPRSF